MGHKVRRQDRLSVGIKFKMPDLNKRLSYKDSNRKIDVYYDDEYKFTYDQNSHPIHTDVLKLRTKVVFQKYYQRGDGKEIDFTQTYIVGQNFIECKWNKTGIVRRREVAFGNINVLQVLTQQDFWS